MREAAFVKQRLEKWETFDALLSQKKAVDPDQLSAYFVELTDDLAYANTYYPQSNTTLYLNNLTSKVHQKIYQNKREDRNRFITFWKEELPLLFYQARKPLLYSFIIFIIAVVIGVVSTAHDETFARLILGDGYVNMTLDNISQGDPMRVYKDSKQADMFFAITFNNIRVSFYAFAMGVLLSIGTGFILLQNGIMLGAFQYLFYQQGLLAESALTIWIHGTIEISSIIIAGGAGLVMGNSILFPGTYPRMVSFQQGARKGAKMVIGLVPLFIMAGFLESFVTRLTELPTLIKLVIIGSSVFLVLYYFVIYPRKVAHHAGYPED
uniref:Stage II sporulation protein M n=1 Tax=Roseihalotalea indica TaxID=2867963 RepID=A0AA49JFC4_9BACT|nr:stage II sporulation protein M [Tunicatimonas sp. TK19036]